MSIKSNSKVLVSDVCDTLFYSNTTFDFIRFVVSKQNVFKRALFHLVNEKWSPLFYLIAIFSRIIDSDISKYLSIYFLKGLTYAKATRLANSFYDEFLMKRKIIPVFELIERVKNDAELILASSSIDVVVKVIAERNNMKYVASVLEVKKDILTGRILIELRGKKHIALQPYLQEVELTVITDNQTDWALANLATHRFIVASKKSEESFWGSLNPTFIYK